MDCPVCYEDITITETLMCGHIIHQTCIIASGKAECPICRRELPHFAGKLAKVCLDPPVWGTLDKLVSLGWLKCADIPIIDHLKLPEGDDLSLVKAVLLLYVTKQFL